MGTAFLLVYFLASPLFGYLGDRWGRLRLMAGGAVLVEPGHQPDLLGALLPFLVAARGLVGVGEASFGTLAPAYLADILPLGRRARALGLFYLALPGGHRPGLPGGRPGGQPLGLAPGLSPGGAAGPAHGRAGLPSPRGPGRTPATERPSVPDGAPDDVLASL